MRGLIFAVYIGSIAFIYSSRGFGKLDEVARIPLIEYLCVLVLALLIGGVVWVSRQVRARRGALSAT